MVFLPHWPKTTANKKRGDLTSFLKLLSNLDNPHLNLPPVIHIAGTNGKGSSVSMLCNILHHAGYKVHSFTSPHMLECNERICLNDNNIADDQLFLLLERVRVAAESLQIEMGFFQAICAAAFLAFKNTPADFVILETGLGGTYDPTNVVPNPLLTLITSISYDHQAVLGNSIEEIASAKAGIIKQNTPCIISAQMDAVYPILFHYCEKNKADYFAYEYDFIAEEKQSQYIFKNRNLELLYSLPHMPGYHQIVNSASVIAAIDYLRNLISLTITDQHIIDALANVQRQGRLSKIVTTSHHSIPNKKIFWLDGAHNISGSIALSEWAKGHLQQPIIMILAMTKNRDIRQFISPFQDIAQHIYTVNVRSEADSYSSEAIIEQIDQLIPTTPCDDLYEAMQHIAQHKTKNIIVTGSLFLIADFYKLLKNQY